MASIVLLSADGRAAAFDDGPGGASCRFYSMTGRLEWANPGGDWVDATGQAQGPRAFSSAAIVSQPASQVVSWDLLALAQQWQQGSALPGAVFLRGGIVDRSAPGVINFSARESADSGARPSLIVRWEDGRIDRLAPSADTYFSCPTQRGLGGEAFLKLGATESALLEFAFVPRPGQRVREATLMLTSPKQYGRGLTIGVYAPRLPREEMAASAREAGLSEGASRDAGLARHADVLFVEDFEDPTRWRKFISDPKTEPSLSTVTADRENGFQALAGKALKVTIRRGTSQGLNHQIRFAELAGGEPDQAFFRYHLRLGTRWDPVIDGGKLPGFSGTYGVAGWGQRRVDGSNGWSLRGAFMRSGEGGDVSEKRAVGTYAYTATTDGALGEVWGWNLGPTGVLDKARWYAIEQQVVLNTPGRADGVLRVWVDGQLAFAKTDVRYRNTTALKIESVWLNVYHGGASQTDRDLTLYIDNVVIARRYIGPGRFAP